MVDRCTNPRNKDWKYYGGRGIGVEDPRWFDFTIFADEMKARPSPQHTLERRDNSRGYCRDHCVWATRREQCNNKRSNHRLTWNGRTQTIMQWVRELGIGRHIIENRLKLHWPIDRIFTTPPLPADSWKGRSLPGNNRRNNRWLTHDGRTLTVTEWSRELGWPVAVLKSRLRYGWSIERILTTVPGSEMKPPPIQANNRKDNHWLTYHGRRLTVTEWARELGWSRSAMYKRLQAGWSTERIFTTPMRDH